MKLSTILLPLLWVICCYSVFVEAAFLSLVLPTSPTVRCTVTSPPASGCLYVSTQTAYCFGQALASGKQRPTLIRFDNGTKTWCRGLNSTQLPFSSSPPNASIYGAGYDTTTGTLWIVGSADGPDGPVNWSTFWTNFTQRGFQKNYGTGTGQFVSLILKVNTEFPNSDAGTFLHSISSSGVTTSLKVTELGLADNGNLIVTADSADLPPGTNGLQPIPSNCVSYSYPLKWTAELNANLSRVVNFCIDPAKYVASAGCFVNTCPGTKQQTVVVSQESPAVTSNISVNGDSTFYSKNNTGSPFTYKLASLIERNPSGNAVKTFAAFSGLQYDLVSNGTTTFQGNPVQRVTLTTTFPVSSSTVTIQVDYYIFLQTGSVTWGAQTFSVDPNTLKNTVTLSNWPFASTSNTLELKIEGVTLGGSVSWNDATKTGSFSSGAKMVFATSAQYNGANSNAAVGVTGSVSGLTLSVLISFNSFTTSVAYDPQLVLTEPSSEASAASRFESFWL